MTPGRPARRGEAAQRAGVGAPQQPADRGEAVPLSPAVADLEPQVGEGAEEVAGVGGQTLAGDGIGQVRIRILERAAALASTEGLERVTIGRLADDLGMSKAGLYGHFGSKERLQLETVAFSGRVFTRHVTMPAGRAPAGLPRLWALCTMYLDYVANGVFPGGDFFVTVANEYDTRPGPIRDEIARVIGQWTGLLETLVSSAVELGHLVRCDPVQVAFEIEALLVAGNHVYRLNDDPRALDLARTGIAQRLEGLRTPRAPALAGRAEPAPA